jgi:hypothetical protein
VLIVLSNSCSASKTSKRQEALPFGENVANYIKKLQKNRTYGVNGWHLFDFFGLRAAVLFVYFSYANFSEQLPQCPGRCLWRDKFLYTMRAGFLILIYLIAVVVCEPISDYSQEFQDVDLA